MGELVTSKGVEGDWGRQNDGEGVGHSGKGCRMGGATSSARRDSKRVETDPLATEKEGQHERRKRTTSDVPRPSTPPPIHPIHPTEHVDPPRRRGRMKSPTTKIRRSRVRRTTYRIVQPRRGQSVRIERIGYIVYNPQMLGEHPAATTKQRDRHRSQSRPASALGQRDHH